MKDKYTIVLEALSTKISENVHKKLGSTVERENMKLKYGDKAFLLPDQKKFPIINPTTGQIDCKLLHAAYVRAKQHNYPEVAAKAKTLMEKHGCSGKLDLNIAQEVIDQFKGEDPYLYETIARTQPEKTNFDPYMQNRGTLERRESTCICKACGYETPLSLDFPSCSAQECPLCGNKMRDNSSAEKTVQESLEEIVENTEPSLNSRFICKSCQSIVTFETKTYLENHCPRCNDNLFLLRESIEFGKRHICNSCKSTYKYESAADNDICPVCNKYMTIFNETCTKLKSKATSKKNYLPLKD